MPLVVPSCGERYDELIANAIDVSAAQLDIIVRGCSVRLALELATSVFGAAVIPSLWLRESPELDVLELSDCSRKMPLYALRPKATKLPADELVFMDILRTRIACLEG